MTDGLLVKQDGAVLRISIDRAQDGSRVSSAMAVEIARVVTGCSEATQLVVLDSLGKDFCNGWTGPGPGVSFAGMDAQQSLQHYDVVFNCYGALRKAAVPVIGVVKGAARGFGAALVSACDIVIAADTAVFQIPEMSHNILPTMVMWSMYDRIPYKALSYLAYTAAEIGAEEARTIGLASVVAPLTEVDALVAKTCGFMLARPPAAIRGLKSYARLAPKMDEAGALEFGRNLHATVNTSKSSKPSA